MLLHRGDHHSGQGQERDRVGNDHELVEHIRELPDEVVGSEGSQEDEYQGDNLVDADCLLAKEVDDVYLAEHVPTEHCGEGKEEQAYRDEGVSEALAEDGAEGCLGEVGFDDRSGGLITRK